MSEKRHLSQLSDDQVEALYKKHNENATQAAREVGCGPSTFRQRISLLKDESYKQQKELKTSTAFAMEELEARGIDPRNVKIQSVTINTAKKRYNAFHKDDETGKAVVTPMSADARGVTIKISPKFDEAFKWPVIQPAAEMPVVYENKVTPVGPERLYGRIRR